MLKERITELMDRYESGEEYLSEYDVQNELAEILDEEYDEELSPKLEDAISDFLLARYEYERYAGHVSDGSDEFIEKIEEIIDYE